MRARSWRGRANLTAGALGKKSIRSIQFQTICGVGDTFDPTITLRAGCPYTPQWDFGNGDTATGTEVSYSGFTDAGPHTVTLSIPNIAYWLVGIDVYNDKIVGDFLGALKHCHNLTSISAHQNNTGDGINSNIALVTNFPAITWLRLGDYTNVYGDISVITQLRNLETIYLSGTLVHGDIANLVGLPSTIVGLDLHTNTAGHGGDGVYGDIANLAGLTSLTFISIGNTYIEGALSDMFPEANPTLTTFYLWGPTVNITGDFSDINAGLPNLMNARLQGLNLAPAALDNLTKLYYLDLSYSDYSEAEVDQILGYLYAARAVNVAPQAHTLLLNAGTSAAPSGTYQDASPPTTGKEFAYKLHNDPDTEGFKTWAITWNGGQAT